MSARNNLSVRTQKFIRESNIQSIEKLKGLVDDEWLIECPKAFSKVYEITQKLARLSLIHEDDIFPQEDVLFRPFNACLPQNLKAVLIAEKPLLVGNGFAFDVDRSSNEKPVSLFRLIRDIQKDTGITSPAMKGEGNSYLSFLPAKGVLLLNYSPTRFIGTDISHRQYWAPFTKMLLTELAQNRPAVRFISSNSSIDLGFLPDNCLKYYYRQDHSNGIFSFL